MGCGFLEGVVTDVFFKGVSSFPDLEGIDGDAFFLERVLSVTEESFCFFLGGTLAFESESESESESEEEEEEEDESETAEISEKRRFLEEEEIKAPSVKCESS